MSSLIDIDPQDFLAALGRCPLSVSHHLVDHPLLSIEALGELADRTPPERIERQRTDLDLVLLAGGTLEGSSGAWRYRSRHRD